MNWFHLVGREPLVNPANSLLCVFYLYFIKMTTTKIEEKNKTRNSQPLVYSIYLLCRGKEKEKTLLFAWSKLLRASFWCTCKVFLCIMCFIVVIFMFSRTYSYHIHDSPCLKIHRNPQRETKARNMVIHKVISN